MEVQGTEEQIGQVILAIEKGWNIRIDKMHSESFPQVRRKESFARNTTRKTEKALADAEHRVNKGFPYFVRRNADPRSRLA